MNRKVRDFAAKPAVREAVPLLVGMFGPSGSGKTYSALRLATGIQAVRGGEIYYVDTEAKRALHYADRFKFQHVEFGAPFGSLDYLDVLRYCFDKGAGVIVIDSMSHEHEGEGGYLLSQEAELTRMAGDDWQKRDKVKFAAWIQPAAQRRHLINGLLQMNAAFIFCFRAKEKTKPVTGGKPIEMGFMPIAGDEFLYEMTVSALLMPGSGGVPTWNPERVGEKLMTKLPAQFRELLSNGQPMSEEHGKALAEWARGDDSGQLKARADALESALKSASTATEVEKVWKRAAKLLASLTSEPALLEDLEKVYESRLDELPAQAALTATT